MREAGPRDREQRSADDTRGGRTGRATAHASALRDHDIVVAMRRGEPAAFEWFVERFHRIVLDYARRAGVADALERDELVSELLDDVAMQLMTRTGPLPQNPRLYLLSAFRHKLLNRKRARERRERMVAEAARAAYACDGVDGEGAAGCSEAMLRASRGEEWERTPLPRAIERLAGRLSEALLPDERQLLVAVAENIPQREVAEWLGVSYVVARKRLERLRARLTDVAMQYATTLEPDDARELQRFFHRCRARIGVRAPAASPPETPSHEATAPRHPRVRP
jgi:RNA polymerase sigma factor (sigma-70 family)